MQNTQQVLSKSQIAAFYHDDFVESQVNDFIKLLGISINESTINSHAKIIADIGGGCGFFAKGLQHFTALKIRVLDTDLYSIDSCKRDGLDADYCDALNPKIIGDEYIVCFNLILHHLIGNSDDETYDFQKRALSVWHSKTHAIFVNEYIYESYFAEGFSAWLIYKITSNLALSKLGNVIAKILPSLKANTFGVGVRFRTHNEWKTMFESIGFNIVDTVKGNPEGVSLPRRLLLIKKCRRDSFLLKPRVMQDEVIVEGEI